MYKSLNKLTLAELNSLPKWCPEYSQSQAFLNCTKCYMFPCAAISSQELAVLMDTPLVSCTIGEMKSRRRSKLMKFVLEDSEGELTAAPKSFNINKPSQTAMRGVVAVHEIKRTLVPTFKLAPKSKEERDAKIEESKTKPKPKRGRPKASASA